MPGPFGTCAGDGLENYVVFTTRAELAPGPEWADNRRTWFRTA